MSAIDIIERLKEQARKSQELRTHGILSLATDEIARLAAVNAAQREALELFLKQWNACGPNSDFGRYFSNVRVAAETALAKGEKP